MSASILDRIVASKRAEVEKLAPRLAEFRAMARDAEAPRGFARALRRRDEVRLLAEVKRRSPSAGDIRPGADPAEIARAYDRGGAAALSVLTDRDWFGGDLDALRAVRAAVPLPVIRKDFLIHPAQVWEARAAGADAVLLIVRILPDAVLAELLGLAGELGMDALVEAHTAEELDRALGAGAVLVGVNNRDLDTFVTDLDLSLRLAPRVPAGVTYVAESGIRTAADVDRLGEAGVDAILVGESLMRQPDVRAAAAALVGRPRRAGARPG
ncbi:MAG TPA: indole-3-glycerol phosphate synthase TrpC [Longimicrobium sp.]|nr:indole-3-glycerol phosphate synthase TrpC [Longimicrobium sp.]